MSTYAVTVTLDEMGDLRPGMNVDGVITLEEAKDVLLIPADALMIYKGRYGYAAAGTCA